MKVTAVVSSFVATPDLPSVSAPRDFHQVDALATALGEALGIEVPIFEGTLADAPAEGYLLVFELRHHDDPRLGPRIIAFEEDRSTIMETAEAFRLAAAIEKHRYFQWSRRRAEERGYGLVGRKDVAERMGARLVGGPYTSAHYGLLASDAADDLIGLLAGYLRAYDQIVAIDRGDI